MMRRHPSRKTSRSRKAPMLSRNKPGHGEGEAGGESADHHDADRAANGIDTGDPAFKIAEDKKTAKRNDGGDLQTGQAIMHEEIRAERNEPTHDIGKADIESAFAGA